ncbi:hypothetical protein [Fuerstiella marisgermanici]|uniref:Putative integral membrane protein n=1 Tax=Fuerstiella marisgermanici TaxID=1891926 RepID=A0A1P8WQZ5_9PLAN|nr:hypothetical protein [Fuerstiella marisgermanici]APZ96482.1 putative integral membrane protein [Fuerstiella marisgermanici]
MSVKRLPRCVWVLGGTGFVSWWLYVAIVWLSRGFRYGTPGPDRPLLVVLCVLAALFGLYVFQVWYATRRCAASGAAMPVIAVFAITFRILLLFSDPIQEVDAYRYLWDGKVAAASVSPFKYSPEQVLTASAQDGDAAEDLRRLVELRDRSAANTEILRRVHFGELTTVYPPVSQLVFTAAACVTPHSASVQTQLLVMKSIVVAFDLATFWLLIALLKFVGRPAEWSIAYAWCPLVMKEFANSGHLDSIAVFLTIATVYCAVRAFYPPPGTKNHSATFEYRLSSRQWTFLAAVALSLAVGAKIYPIVLAPLLFFSAWRKVGRVAALSARIVVLTLSALMITPMLSRDKPEPEQVVNTFDESPPLPPVPTLPATTSPPKPSTPGIDPTKTGLSAFAGQWQMNDFLFLLVSENLKGPVKRPTPWFVIVPLEWRENFITFVAQRTSLHRSQIPFLAARLVTGAVFIMLALGFAWRGMKSDCAEDWLRAVFLTIAWFWLLQPTQNPWYWTWALPFIPFARSRAWLAVSGLVLLYYARFWFSYHAAETQVLGTPYVGVTFFDYVVTWIEYCPWFVWLAWTSATRSYRHNVVR